MVLPSNKKSDRRFEVRTTNYKDSFSTFCYFDEKRLFVNSSIISYLTLGYIMYKKINVFGELLFYKIENLLVGCFCKQK